MYFYFIKSWINYSQYFVAHYQNRFMYFSSRFIYSSMLSLFPLSFIYSSLIGIYSYVFYLWYYLSKSTLFSTLTCIDGVGKYVSEQNRKNDFLYLWIFHYNMRKSERKKKIKCIDSMPISAINKKEIRR